MARRNRPPRPDSRLPRWTWLTIAAGGIATFAAVGRLLLGWEFGHRLEQLVTDPAVFFGRGAENFMPIFLLLIPAGLGAMFTRDGLRIVFKGIRQGDAAHVVAKELAIFLLGCVVLVLVGLFTSSARSHH